MSDSTAGSANGIHLVCGHCDSVVRIPADRLEQGPDYDDLVVVVCNEGFYSSLAAREPALSDYGGSEAESERLVQGSLENLFEGRTTIVIAHRLSTIVDANQIIVLDQGRVAERGSHAQLLRRNGLYAEMWARQQADREQEEIKAAE